MAKLTDKDWLEIKTKYQLGHNVRKIADEYGYDAGNLVKKAKKEGWEHGKIQQPIATATNIISEITTDLQQEEVNVVYNEITTLLGLKNKAGIVQNSMLDLIKLASSQAKSILQENPSGLHIKSQGENGNTFGRNTEFVKDLIPAMNAANAILGIGKEQPTTAIQINNSTHADVTMPSNAIDASRAYQELINGSK